MAYSYARYTSAGSTGPYSVPFSYRLRGDVAVYVDGVSVPFTWATSSTVTLNSAPAVGALIEIRRATSEAARLTQWLSVNQIDKDNLEALSLQSFNLAQEAIDTARDAKAKALRVPDKEADIGPIPSATARANRYLGFDASGNITLYQGEQLGGTIDPNTAPSAAQYLTLATNATLTNERVLTAGTGVGFTDGGAGSTLTVSLADNGVSNTKLADMAQNRIKGRVSSGTGDPEDLTAAQLVSIITTADGAGTGLDADTVDGIQGASLVQTSRQVLAGAGMEGGGTLATDQTIGIAGGGVSNTMLANMAPNTVKGRITGSTGSPENLTAGNLVSIISTADGPGSGLDADTVDGIQGSALIQTSRLVSTGTGLTGGGDLSADRTIAIATNGVTNALLAQVTTNTIKGRVTAGTGNVEDLTPAQVVSFLQSADGASSGLDADLLDGLQATDFVRTTRAVNTSGPLSGGGALSGDLTLTIGANSLTNSYLSQVATNTIRGRLTAGTGNIEDLSVTQVTSMLNAMVGATAGTGGTKGLVPAPAAGDQAKYLRGDGTWGDGGGGGSGAPVAGKYIAYAADTGLSDERVLAIESGVLTITDSGTGGGNITIGIATSGIANGKLANMTAGTFKGRNTGTGAPEDLSATQATALLNAMVGATGGSAGTKGLVPAPAAGEQTLYLRGDGTWAAPSGSGAPTTATYVTISTDATLTNERTLAAEASVLTLTDGGAGAAATIGVAANGITNAKFRQGAALSVVGVTGNATANVADIAAGVDGHVLRRSGTALAFGTIATAGIADSAVTLAKIANIATARVLGRVTAGSGVVEELTVTAPITLTGGGLNWDNTTALGNNARVAVSKAGAAVGTRRKINFIEGSNVTLTIADDAGNEEVDVTIAATGGGGGAPTGASYITLGTDATLTAERVLTAGAGISIADGGAGTTATVAMDVNAMTAAPATVSYANDYVPIYSANATAMRKLPLKDVRPTEAIVIACTDETTSGIVLSTSVPKVTFRMPYAFTMTDIKASLNVAQASGATLFTVDVKKNGTSIFTTKLTFDNTETTTVTAVTPKVLTTTPMTFADDDVVTIFVDTNQAGNVAAGLKVTMIGSRT
jgi:hypothetical protein